VDSVDIEGSEIEKKYPHPHRHPELDSGSTQACGDLSEMTISLTGDNAAHGNVLRLHIGEEIIICSDMIDYNCKVKTITKGKIVADVIDAKPNENEMPTHITLFQALPKGDKMGDIIERSVELGVAQIIPIITSRCISRPKKEEGMRKVAKWQKNAEAAAKHAHRGYVPKIGDIISLEKAAEMAKGMDAAFVCYEGEQDARFGDISTKTAIGIFVGSEGGFSAEEVESLKTNNITPITLGRRILRTENAAAFALAYINFLMFHKI